MSLEPLVRWRELLAQLGELGGALARAIASGDVVAALAAMVELRRLRSALAAADEPTQLGLGNIERATITDIQGRMLDAHEAAAAMQLWQTRAIPGDAQLLRSPLGVAVLADSILPAIWDYQIDPVVLVGPGLDGVAELLAAIGQQRIVLHASGAAPDAIAGVLITNTDDELVAAIRTMVPCPPGRYVLRAALGIATPESERISDQVRATLGDLRIHRNTVHAFSRTWIEQGVANLPSIARWPSIAALDGKFTGMPMIIVAPGPSLAGNVAQLRALRGRAIVTAFSHSLKPILAAGVVPDLIVTVDPQDVAYHFAGCDVSRSCMVSAATAHPKLYDLDAPRCLTLSANVEIDDWIYDALGERPIAPGGGSVATSAYSLALRWGCDPIVFVGLDLSFPGGNYYVSTSADGDARAVVGADGNMHVAGWSAGFHDMKSHGGPAAATERALELPGWHGGTVPSSFMFSMFHRWFVDRTRAVTGVRVYNCTEGGAFIDGMSHRPLADVLGELDGPVDVTGILDAAIAAVTPERGERLAARLRRVLDGLRVVRRVAKRAQALARTNDPALERKLAATELELAEALRPLELVSLLAQREIERAQDAATRAAPADRYRAASARLFDVLLAVIDQLAPVLRATHAELVRSREIHHDAA